MTKKKSLLICLPEIPYPVRRNGVSIRYFPIIAHLSKTYEIDLLLISKEIYDETHISKLKEYTRNLFYFVRPKRKPNVLKRFFFKLVTLIPGHTPLEVFRYDNKLIIAYIIEKTGGYHYDAKLSVTTVYAGLIREYVNADRYIIDCIDSVYADLSSSSTGTLLNKHRLSMIRHWEIECISKADFVSYVSPLDIEILTGTKDSNELKNIEVVPNGIYIDDYSSDKVQIDGFLIGFLGNMDYFPNIQAALRLAKIFNGLKSEIPDLKLLIIGRNPSREVLNLKESPGIIVTGAVDTIWPYVNATDIFVFPMEYGCGQQNKLLDVMYASRPVISSSLGNSGIGARDGQEVVIADTNDEIKEKIFELYSDSSKREGFSNNGKKFIDSTYGWDNVFKKIESKYFQSGNLDE